MKPKIVNYVETIHLKTDDQVIIFFHYLLNKKYIEGRDANVMRNAIDKKFEMNAVTSLNSIDIFCSTFDRFFKIKF